jgi:hypothetical protein
LRKCMGYEEVYIWLEEDYQRQHLNFGITNLVRRSFDHNMYFKFERKSWMPSCTCTIVVASNIMVRRIASWWCVGWSFMYSQTLQENIYQTLWKWLNHTILLYISCSLFSKTMFCVGLNFVLKLYLF